MMFGVAVDIDEEDDKVLCGSAEVARRRFSMMVKFQQRYVKSHRNLTCWGSLASDPHGLNRVLVSLIDRLQRQMLYRVLV